MATRTIKTGKLSVFWILSSVIKFSLNGILRISSREEKTFNILVQIVQPIGIFIFLCQNNNNLGTTNTERAFLVGIDSFKERFLSLMFNSMVSFYTLSAQE